MKSKCKNGSDDSKRSSNKVNNRYCKVHPNRKMAYKKLEYICFECNSVEKHSRDISAGNVKMY
jgi:hypothetical protein